MNSSNPWRISSLVSACYEFVLALFILFQMLLTLLALEVVKFLPMSHAFSCNSRRQHNTFCSGHFPPFSPCRERDHGQFAELPGAARTPTRFSRGFPPARALSGDFPAGRDGSEMSSLRRAGLANQARSLSLSSVYKRNSRHNSSAILEEISSECKVDGETCQCIPSGLDLYDDLIEVSSEYLKQKDRGHEEVILSLLKALQVERRNLRSLYEELEEERVAAETAANEAMAMILRLQEEKSALQMEADHYQRMAEEKALHDEHAIQLLEEDLCRKEDERFLLEEELNELRNMSCVDDLNMAEKEVKAPCRSLAAKRLLLLTSSIEEAPNEAEHDFETIIKPEDIVGLKCNTATTCTDSKEKYCADFPSQDLPMKRFKSSTRCERLVNSKDVKVSHESVERMFIEPIKSLEKFHPNDEDDAKAILVQLSAVEKQLLTLEESEKLELWQQAQGSQDSWLISFLSPDKSKAWSPNKNGENDGDLLAQDARASETDASSVLDEEKVVNVDVANVLNGPCCATQLPASEENLQFNEEKCQRSKTVQWEAFEDEKHLDSPSFVRSSSSIQAITSMVQGTCKPMVEDEIWDAKRITLEGINLRLQALESKNTLLRHRSVPSDYEHVNLVLLKQIMQELQELLKANRNLSATNEPMSADAQGT